MSRPKVPDITPEEFWATLDRTGDCWTWSGTRNRQGYGRAKIGGSHVGTHRIAWMLANDSAIPAGGLICHHCDNPPCCRPDHLYLGDHSTNIRDAYARGRIANHRQPRPVTAESILIQPGQAADLLGISTKDLGRLADCGVIDHIRLFTGTRRYYAASVREYASRWDCALAERDALFPTH